MLKTLIVDDEYPARMELRFQLGRFADVEIIGEAANAREAMRLIEAVDYDVIFMDVHMPGVSGMELAQQLKRRADAPKIVFVTAYEDYALPAFEVRAVDYLLKPFESARLAETIQRLRELNAEGSATKAQQTEEESRPPLHILMCEKEERQIPLSLRDIIYIFSEGYHVYVQTYSERLLTRHTLQDLAERLPADQFFRTHRSYLINIFQVAELSAYFNGAYLLKMKDRERSEVIVSRSNVKRLKEIFSMN